MATANAKMKDGSGFEWHKVLEWTYGLLALGISLFILAPIILYAVLGIDGLGPVGAAFLFLPFLVSAIFAVLSLPAYYADAKRLRQRDAGWQPNSTVWIVAGIFLTPYIINAVYLWKRRKVS
jgi:hypothetical protein